MQPITNVQTMRRSDAATVESGIAGRELMYRAAKGVFDSYPWQGKVCIICGGGNNAGDGYALALLLYEANIACTIVLLSDVFTADGAYYFDVCKTKGIEITTYTDTFRFDGYTEIVDCIFGTGFHGAVQGMVKHAIEQINQSGKIVISVDINSGLDGDRGLAELCVRSDLTVSIAAIKQGLLLNQAKDFIKRIVNVDIGIKLTEEKRYLTEAGDFRSILRPRSQDSHKGTYGYISIMGGCTEYGGAIKLANLSCAALRAGCGVAQLILPRSLAPAVAPYLLESTLAILEERDGKTILDIERLDRILSKQAALAIGMGWGQSEENAKNPYACPPNVWRQIVDRRGWTQHTGKIGFFFAATFFSTDRPDAASERNGASVWKKLVTDQAGSGRSRRGICQGIPCYGASQRCMHHRHGW